MSVDQQALGVSECDNAKDSLLREKSRWCRPKANYQLMGLQQAAFERKAVLDQQAEGAKERFSLFLGPREPKAAQATLEYEQKRVADDFARTQCPFLPCPPPLPHKKTNFFSFVQLRKDRKATNAPKNTKNAPPCRALPPPDQDPAPPAFLQCLSTGTNIRRGQLRSRPEQLKRGIFACSAIAYRLRCSANWRGKRRSWA